MIIREIELSDYNKGCVSLYEQDFNIKPEQISFYDFCKYITKKRSNNYKIFVYEMNSRIAALSTCFIEEKIIHNFGKVGHIEDVIVDKNIRKCGIGKKMINACIDYAKTQKCYKIILDCSEENAEFYKKCGFMKKGCYMSIYF